MPPVNAGRWRWEDAGFEASLSYVVKHCLKAKPSEEVFGRPKAAVNLTWKALELGLGNG